MVTLRVGWFHRPVPNVTFSPFASTQPIQSFVQLLQHAVIEIMNRVSQLIRISQYVVVRDKPGNKLAVKKIMRSVDGTSAPVRIVIRVGTRTKRPQGPKGRDFPMIVVLLETIHILYVTFVMPIFPHFLPFFLRHSLGILPVEHRQIFISNVIPTEITIFAAEIRRLNGRQHVE